MLPALRPARPDDLDDVLALWAAADAQPTATDTREALEVLVAHDPEALVVADDDGAVVGSLITGWDGWRGTFHRLAVSPDHRRAGLALLLVAAGEDRLRHVGAGRAVAVVVEGEDAAEGFWEAAGYERQETRHRYVRNL